MRLAAAALAAAALALTGCGGGDERLTVLAAASLADALPLVDPGPRYSFAASGLLAAQVREGAPADVLAVADEGIARDLHERGLVEEPRPLATNRLAIIVPAGNPQDIRDPADLARPGLRWVIAREGVPAGDYAREGLARLGLGGLPARAAGLEADARAVATRVALGEADAGIAYVTDAGEGLEAVPLPAAARATARYAVAVVRAGDDPAAARAYVERLLGAEGRAALRAAGFGPP